MQAMKRRVTIAGAAVVMGLLAPLVATAPPATAGTGVGCGSSDCSIHIWQFVQHSKGPGWNDSGGSADPIAVTPPPCLWNPIGDATTGSQYIVSEFGNAGPGTAFDVYNSVQQAKKLLANPEPGDWYELPVNPAAGPEGEKKCLQLPLFAWVVPGDTPPMPPIPPRNLAEYAYNHMQIPQPTVNTSGKGQGWVNLATYVWIDGQQPIHIWASLGAVRVDLTARPVRTDLSTTSAGEVTPRCKPKGSRYPENGPPPPGGPGKMPDCGVLWRAPTNSATISATVTWRVTYTSNAGPPGVLPPMQLTGTSLAFPVSEIQSING